MRARLAIVAFAGLALLGCGGEASAPVAEATSSTDGQWKVDMADSRLGFSGTQTGTPFEGEFETFDATIILDPDDLATASIDVTVNMTSAKTGDRQRDSALPGSDWFKAREFPTARYLASRIEKQADGTYLAQGELTIRGVTKPVPLPFTLTIEGDAATAKGEASLIRSDYGVGQGDFADETWVGLEVKVTVDIKAVR